MASFHGCASDGKKDYGVADTNGRAASDSPRWAILWAAEQAMEKKGAR